MPQASPSALIIRLDGIGDALALTPMLAALRARAVPVDVVASETNAGIFAARAVRRVIVAAIELRSDSKANRDAIERLGRTLRSQGYSHVIVATEDAAGYRLSRAIAAPARIGFSNGWGKPLKSLWSRRMLTHAVYRSAGLDRRGPHECEVLFRLAAPLLSDEKPTRDVARLRPLVLDGEPAPDARVAVQLTAKWQRIGISARDVGELVRRVAEAHVVRLLSSQNEAPYAYAIAQPLGLPVDAFGDVGVWKEAIGAAAALVAPDSGAMHVAAMVGTPVAGIFPPSRNFALNVARWSPWAAPFRVVRSDEKWPARAADAVNALLGDAR